MFWRIDSFPRCEHHVFLSHCAKDRAGLVYPVHDELRRRGIVTWLDRDHYYYGRDSRAALRDGLLLCRHAVFFISLGMLDYRRGWCPMKLAYSGLVQANRVWGGATLLNYELPLIFLDRNNPELPRSAWSALRDKASFHHPIDGDPVEWAVNQIADFLDREQRLAMNMAKVVGPGHGAVMGRTGLLERVTLFDPKPIPPTAAHSRRT
jgi:hypothetical protein